MIYITSIYICLPYAVVKNSKIILFSQKWCVKLKQNTWACCAWVYAWLILSPLVFTDVRVAQCGHHSRHCQFKLYYCSWTFCFSSLFFYFSVKKTLPKGSICFPFLVWKTFRCLTSFIYDDCFHTILHNNVRDKRQKLSLNRIPKEEPWVFPLQWKNCYTLYLLKTTNLTRYNGL